MLDAPIAHHFHAMGCPCELRIGGQSPQRVIERCLKEVARFESKYSRYQPDSIVSKINHNAGKAAVALDPETGSILDYAQTCFELSNGLFDITSGVLRTIWNKDTKLFPAQSSINEVLSLIGWEKVERSLEQIYLPQPGMQIDLGGVVKEYVADALIELISATGIKNALVNLGGDIAVLGPQPSGEPWHIGVTDPDNPGSAVASIDLSEGAITTSGGYERVFEIEGHPYSHLLNPKNGMPVDNLLGVSIVAPQAIVAGSLSTIALLKPEQEAKKWLEDCGAPYLAIDRQRDISGSLATTR